MGFCAYTATGVGVTSNLATEATAAAIDSLTALNATQLSAFAGTEGDMNIWALATDSTGATVKVFMAAFPQGLAGAAGSTQFACGSIGIDTAHTNAISNATLQAAGGGSGRIVIRCRQQNSHF